MAKQTIQATGKDAKLLSLLGSFIIICSVFLIFTSSIPNHNRLAVWGIVLGVCIRLLARALAWWKYR
ncbi:MULTISPECIES: hypothetical protein [Burkholderia]|uniref:hypothetical protein n=1 Tax=Burkholderia TaxID=32008 RepID=UPI000752EC89|nr:MULTISPECIES: hypothetical protein [Burkholderia]AOJ69355.1 hypothetical protein WS78_11775 [Burkholderia savannae]KVG37474.1 hypothetical protein WS77_02005 [Burkholderia sp. MSMB0265]KVG88262.1 hypothetical protein WS81_25220 [Burkholderia sp. MSMB2040]KVG93813.1 hypothetical protein WS82_08715 [Burkholderia sp. MSMB2041]KVH01065.1 hypothetical protein WS83_20275 [Burkholderia sp. MSMB2042]